MAITTTVQCPSCDTSFPIDPDKVPAGGVRTRCTVCETQFRVDGDMEGWQQETEAAATLGGLPLVDGTEPDGDGEVYEADDMGMDEDHVLEADLEENIIEVESDDDVVDVEADIESDVEADEGDPLADWVVETEDTSSFGMDPDDLDVDRLNTVEETVRAAGEEESHDQGGDMSDFMTADEVMLSPEDLGMNMDDVEMGGVDIEGDETPELPPLEPADEDPFSHMAAVAEEGPETVLEDLDEVETVFEPEDAEELVPEPMATGEDDPLFDEAESGVEAFEGQIHEVEAELEEVETGLDDASHALEDAAEEAASADVGEAMEAEVEDAAAEAAPAPQGFQFGRRDPHEKARRLARVLVSDMITYNPDRHATALERDTLEEDFEEEIEKSWAEYVEQVGRELADSTTYWTDALNEILAKGRPLF